MQSPSEAHAVVCLQEAWGMKGYLGTMPSFRLWVGSFMAFSAARGGLSGGGVVMWVARRLVVPADF